MTTFYLIRHGEKEPEKGDPTLSEIGKKQASLVGKYLSQFPITAIYASPLLRTRQTAEAIAKEVAMDIAIDERFRERMNWELPEQTFEEFVALWNKASVDPSFQPAGGDSVAQTASRFGDALYDLTQKYPNEHIVIVSHGGAIRDFLYMQKKEAIEELLNNRPIIHECSVTKIYMGEDTLEVEYVNLTDHLL